MSEIAKRLLIVSNRLPVVIEQIDGHWGISPAAGGLVTAMAPTMRKNRGTWVGWPGCTPDAPAGQLLQEYSLEAEFDLVQRGTHEIRMVRRILPC